MTAYDVIEDALARLYADAALEQAAESGRRGEEVYWDDYPRWTDYVKGQRILHRALDYLFEIEAS